MLGLQAVNLEQQEKLFKNQIRLGLREILQQELAFYSNAFNNISACASILAGFAFTGIMLDPYDHKSDAQPKWVQHQTWDASRAIEATFNFSCASTTCICLLTVVYSNYLGLFSTRLALRGGEMAVEDSVMKVRGEYKVVLYALTACVECFIFTLTVLAFYKMELLDCYLVSGVCVPSGVAVIYLYRRARQLFYLDKDDRFAAAKKKKKSNSKSKSNSAFFGRFIHGKNDDYEDPKTDQIFHDEQAIYPSTQYPNHLRASEATSVSDFGTGRLSEIVQEVDGRNNSQFDNSGHGRGGGGYHVSPNRRYHPPTMNPFPPPRRSDSWERKLKQALNDDDDNRYDDEEEDDDGGGGNGRHRHDGDGVFGPRTHVQRKKVPLAEQEASKSSNKLTKGWSFLKNSKKSQSMRV